MNEKHLLEYIEKLQRGEIEPSDLLATIKSIPFKDLGEIKLDTHRSIRQGFAEIIYCPGKSDEQLSKIALALRDSDESILFSRINKVQFDLLKKELPDLEHYPQASIAGIKRSAGKQIPGLVVATGGSSDVPVAEEAAVTAEHMGCSVTRLYDVGVAGVHRLLAHVETLQKAKVIIAVAGMEGALPGVIAGLVPCPVIGVPTDVGYGVNLKGISPLLTMLNSCATGVTVVNINNGLGAGYTGAMIARQSYAEKRP
jgi:NCAIR mutase (PurE)-related protein